MNIKNANFIHLDLKGSIPPAESIISQLSLLSGYGYNGVVLEYEDRLQWKTWQGISRHPFTPQEHKKLLEHCRSLNLEVVPLIQSLGHCEWILKHGEYSSLRENGTVSELCPSNPNTKKKLFAWIDEVLELHPGCRLIHIGGDEPFHLATCQECKSHAEKLPGGKTALYLEHISDVCNYIISKGVRPIIWADAFSRSGNISLIKQFPPEVILTEWRYNGIIKESTIRQIQATGHDVLGCAGICTGYFEHTTRIEERLDDRFLNVRRWQKVCQNCGIGRINAVWGRGTGLWEIYSPWHGHWPVMIYAANPEAWKRHPWYSFFNRLNRAVLRNYHTELLPLAEELKTLPAANQAEQDCLDYWALALHYQSLAEESLLENSQLLMLRNMKPFCGEDPWVIANRFRRLDELDKEYLKWAEDTHKFFNTRKLTDKDEFITGRLAYLKALRALNTPENP